MEKRYQIFLSSTFEDLKEERLEAMKAIIELEHFPCGMEYFPASDDSQWQYIKSLIDQCDYYVVIVGGRYGSLDETGKSYTQKEFEYAVSQGVPALAFIHEDTTKLPVNKTDQDDTKSKKLLKFRQQLQKKLCKTWASKKDLYGAVGMSLVQLIKKMERTGWVRANNLASSEATNEILALRLKNDELRQEVNELLLETTPKTEDLAQGEDSIEIDYKMTLTKDASKFGDTDRNIKYIASVKFTWDQLFSFFAIELIPHNTYTKIKSSVERAIRTISSPKIEKKNPGYKISSTTISGETLNIIALQFNALGIISIDATENEKGTIKKIVSLTTKGEKHLLSVNAIKKHNH